MADEIKGHAFDFDTKCLRCGMTRNKFDDLGQPSCNAKKPAALHETEQGRKLGRPDQS